MGPAAAAFARRLSAGLAVRAADRGITATSLNCAALLFALCGSAWFSGGMGLDLFIGMIALVAWLLLRAAAWCAASPAPLPRQRPAASTDWMISPGPLAGLHAAAAADGAARRAVTRLAVVCALAGEFAIYGGIAAGGQSAGWTGMWPLAVTTVIVIALAETLIACSGAAAVGGLAAAIGRGSVTWAWIGRILAPSSASRAVLAGLALLAHGPRVALFAVLAAQVAAVGVTGWRLIKFAADLAGPGRRAMAGRAAPARRSGAGRQERPAPAGRAQRASRDVVLACRDDGALACWAGRLVRGNIMPLPPIFAGICAVVLLSWLGLGNLPGIVALAPFMALLLAAPGAGHRHSGRSDWLAPVLLALSQYVYLAALGFARAVPGPVVFSLCALTAIWYASLAVPTVQSTRGTHRDGIGWESRMFIVTFAVIVQIATAGYLVLSVYLGVLICRKVVAGYLTPEEVGSG